MEPQRQDWESQNFAEAVNFLTEKGIATLDDLEAHIAAQSEQTEAINASIASVTV